MQNKSYLTLLFSNYDAVRIDKKYIIQAKLDNVTEHKDYVLIQNNEKDLNTLTIDGRRSEKATIVLDISHLNLTEAEVSNANKTLTRILEESGKESFENNNTNLTFEKVMRVLSRYPKTDIQHVRLREILDDKYITVITLPNDCSFTFVNNYSKVSLHKGDDDYYTELWLTFNNDNFENWGDTE